jgi:hypothetical protein
MTGSAAWQIVTCSGCGRRYRCTPVDDYYNATTPSDGVCQSCLLTDAGIDPAKFVDLTLGHVWTRDD